jgi:Domain of unknown function (DUF4340)
MMKMRQLIAAVVVLAALAATLYWSNHRKPSEDTSKSTASATVTIVSLKPDDISKLEVKRSSGDDVVLNRSGGNKWKIVSPTSLFADQDTVSAMLYALSPLDNAALIEEKSGDLKAYGLASPAATVTATTKDGNTQTILVGDDTPTGGASYAALSGDPKVYSISTGTKSSLNKGLSDLRDKRLLPVDFEKLTAVEVAGPKLNLTFGSDNGQWTVRNPKNVRGDTSKLENIVEKLKLADMDPSTTEEDKKKAAALFASGTPIATVKATDASGTQELQVRKNKAAYYAKTTAMDGAYKVADALGEAVDKTLEDFREKRLFDFAQETPDKIELHDGPKAYFLSQNNDDWWMDGKKLDPLSVDALLRSIRQLTATKFVSAGFAGPALTLTVTSKGGKLVENVDFSKSSGVYIARRADAATLYELDAKEVEELQKTAGDLKPAETVPVKK